MHKHVNLVDLVKSFPTNIYLQNLASIQKRTSPVKFAHLAEKSENGSISNLSTKVAAAPMARSHEKQQEYMANFEEALVSMGQTGDAYTEAYACGCIQWNKILWYKLLLV